MPTTYRVINSIPPLREADSPRKYRLPVKPELGTIIKRMDELERTLTETGRRARFPKVGEEIAQKIRR